MIVSSGHSSQAKEYRVDTRSEDIKPSLAFLEWEMPLELKILSARGKLGKALGIGTGYIFIPVIILSCMLVGLAVSIFAAHDFIAHRGIWTPLPRAPLVTGFTEIFSVLWLFEVAERLAKHRWREMRPLLPRWSKFVLVSLLCILLLWATNTHS